MIVMIISIKAQFFINIWLGYCIEINSSGEILVNNNAVDDLKTEWSLLQNQCDSYEKYSLIIKLANVSLISVAYFTGYMGFFVGCLLLTLWLQDAIWKTYQSRIENRILHLEDCLKNSSDGKAFQLNSDFQNNRTGAFQLIVEYFSQAIRPTVAFPHVVLVLMLGWTMFI